MFSMSNLILFLRIRFLITWFRVCRFRKRFSPIVRFALHGTNRLWITFFKRESMESKIPLTTNWTKSKIMGTQATESFAWNVLQKDRRECSRLQCLRIRNSCLRLKPSKTKWWIPKCWLAWKELEFHSSIPIRRYKNQTESSTHCDQHDSFLFSRLFSSQNSILAWEKLREQEWIVNIPSDICSQPNIPWEQDRIVNSPRIVRIVRSQHERSCSRDFSQAKMEFWLEKSRKNRNESCNSSDI